MLTITSVLVVLSLLFGGAGATVVAAQDSMPGQALYTVKTATEDFRFLFMNSEDAQLEGALQFASRRVAEATAMAEEGNVYTKQEWKVLEERLEKNLKDALLAAAASENPEAALTKIKAQIHIWDVVDYKRDQERDGTYHAEEIDANMYQHAFQYMFKNMLKLVGEELENPNEFKHSFQNRFGQDAEELDLLAEDEPLPGDPPVTDPQGTQTKAGEEQGYGPEDNPFGAQNQGETPEFQNQNQGEGYGPAGEDVGNPDKPAAPGEPNQSGSGTQTQQGGKP
jgi:hypothetical protein